MINKVQTQGLILFHDLASFHAMKLLQIQLLASSYLPQFWETQIPINITVIIVYLSVVLGDFGVNLGAFRNNPFINNSIDNSSQFSFGLMVTRN